MGIPVLIIGKSGSGKSSSLRNFGKEEITLINVLGKPLPFKGKFRYTAVTDNYEMVTKILNRAPTKSIIIDDAGYMITNMYMRESKNKAGNAIFNFYIELAEKYWQLVEQIKTLPADVIVYLIMHEEQNDFGEVKAKTIGKMLDEKICLEGMFSIVLRSVIQDGHFFKTKASNDVAKAPIDMFENDLIDNDLKAVDAAIREFYEINGGTENEKA